MEWTFQVAATPPPTVLTDTASCGETGSPSSSWTHQNMSARDESNFCQSMPIPLRPISAPSYRSPFSNLQQFQVDVDFAASTQQQSSLWRKLQSSLIRVMSNLVVIAHTVAPNGPMLSRHTSSVVQSKSFQVWDPVLPWSEPEPKFCKSTMEKAFPEESPSYYPIPTVLEGLHYFATHPFSYRYEESIRKQKVQGSLSMSSSPHTSRSLATPVLSPTSEVELEIIIDAVSTSQDQFFSQLQRSSPTPPTAEQPEGTSGEAGCSGIETNWRTKNGMSSCQEEVVSLANFHPVSVCSQSSPTRGRGTLTFSCSSTLSSPPKGMAKPCDARRRKTEFESSSHSFVQFSSSVESTDSFCIVFEPVGGCTDEEVLNREEEYDDDEDWQDDSDSDDEDENDSDEDEGQVFNNSIFIDTFDWDADQVDLQPEVLKKKKTKRVSFNEDNLARVIEFEDDPESRNSRETYWETVALDRTRFQDRIFRTGDILQSILEPAHRLKVFQQSFGAEN